MGEIKANYEGAGNIKCWSKLCCSFFSSSSITLSESHPWNWKDDLGIDADASSVNELNGKASWSKIVKRHAACLRSLCQSKCHYHCHLIHIAHLLLLIKILLIKIAFNSRLASVWSNFLSSESRDYSLAWAVTQDAKCHSFLPGINRRRCNLLKFWDCWWQVASPN